jgi:hypothetical protein
MSLKKNSCNVFKATTYNKAGLDVGIMILTESQLKEVRHGREKHG